MKKGVLAGVIAAVVLGGATAAYLFWPTSANYLKSGRKYYDQQKYREAAIQFLNAVAHDSRNRDAQYYLALSYLKLNDIQQTIAHLKTLLEYQPDDVPANLQLGNIYVAIGPSDSNGFTQARRIAEHILAKDPKNVDGLILSGSASDGVQNYDAAALMFQRALDIDPLNVDALIKLGITRTFQKRYADAEESLLKARQIDSKNMAAAVGLVAFYRDTDQKNKAENLIKESLSTDSTNRGFQQLAVEFYSEDRRFDELEATLKTLQEKGSGDPNASLLLADLYFSRNRSTDALNLLLQTKRQFPADTTVAAKTAEALISTKPDLAQKEIDQVLKAEPTNPLGHVLLGELRYATGQYDAAEAELGSNPALNSSFPNVQLILGNISRRKGKVNDAIAHYQKSIAVNKSGYVPARIALAQVLLEQGKIADSREEIRKALETQPDNVTARIGEVRLDIVERKFPDAERKLKTLMMEQPGNPDVLREMAFLDASRGRIADARKNLERALELRPDSHEILRELTVLDVENKQTGQAIQRINAFPDDAKQATDYEMLGSVYSQAGQLHEAEQAYKKALEKDPSRTAADMYLFENYRRTGRIAEGLQLLNDVIKRDPSSGDAYLLRASVYENQGNIAEAKKNYQEALRLKPDSPVIENNLAWLLAEEGKDLQSALQYAQDARKRAPESPIVADTLGWVDYKLRNFQAACDQGRFAVSKDPENGTFLYHLAMCYESSYQVEDALATMKKAVASKKDFKEKPLAQAALKELSK